MLHRYLTCLVLISSLVFKCNSYQDYDYYDDSEEDTSSYKPHDHGHHTHTSHQLPSSHQIPSSHQLPNSHHIPSSYQSPSSRQLRSRTEDKKLTYHEARSIDRSDTANTFEVEQRVLETERLYKPHRGSETATSVQKAQEQERRRLESRAVEPVERTEGSYKIVNYPSIAVAKRRGQTDVSSSDIMFPGPATRSSVPLQLVPESVPEECRKLGLCETVPNYPKEHVDMLLSKLGQEKLKLKVDEADVEIAQRIGPPDEMKLCDDIERVFIPQAAPDKTGKWYYVVNQKETPLQGFHVSICRNDGSPCSTDVATYRPGYRASCKQKYVLRSLASIADNGTLVQRYFKLPSCCSCVVVAD